MSQGNSLTPGEWFSLIAERAPALRAAGVTRLVLDGTEIDFAPHMPDVKPAIDAQFDYSDPLDDPATYGNTGNVPGYRIPRAFPDDDYGAPE